MLVPRVRSLRVLVAFFLLSSANCESSTAPAPRVGSIDVTQAASGEMYGVSLPMGDTTRFAARVNDPSGAPMTGLAVQWVSSNETVATIDPSGLATARASGVAYISALTATVAGEITLTVTDTAVVRVDVTPAYSSIGVNGALVLTATARDGAGTAVRRAISWAAADPTKVSLSAASGAHVTATGLALTGPISVRATLDNHLVGTASVSVVSGLSPIVTSVSPSPLVAGGSAVITGANFDPNAALDSVLVEGVAAPVTAASPTQLTVVVPHTLPCGPVRDVAVQVTTATLAGSRLLPFQPAQVVSLPVGGSVFFDTSSAQGACLSLPVVAGAAYLVGVYGTPPIASARSAFMLSSSPPAVALGVARAAATARPAAFLVRPSPSAPAEPRAADAHMRLLERNRRILQAMAGRRGVVSSVPSRISAALFDPQVGDVLSLNIPDIDRTGDYCANGFAVRARVVYVGAKSVVLEDNANATAGRVDATLQLLGAEMENIDYPLVTANFGDPLWFDPHLAAKGKVLMLISRRVNAFYGGSLHGFVSPCDFFQRDSSYSTSNRTSNEAAIFYGRALASLDSLADWRAWMRGTAPHELKHIASVAAKMTGVNSGNWEESWLEEGTAQIADELYGRVFTGQTWRGHAQWSTTVGCEPPANQCGGDYPYALQHNFMWLYNYLDSLPQVSPVGATRATQYGETWSLVRWLVDQYATSESQMLTDMVNAARVGTANLEDRAGHVPFAQLYSRWLMASALPRYAVAPTDPLLTLPSWDQASIFQGLSAIRPSYPLPYPLVAPTLPFGDFQLVAMLPGGGMLLYELSGPQLAAQPVSLRAYNGAPLPPDSPIRIAVVRVR